MSRTAASLWLVLVVGAAACSEEARNNPYDPDGTGPRAPGRVAGTLFVQGYPVQSGFAVHVTDDLGSEAAALSTGDDGSFLTAEIAAGVYSVVIDVPAQNSPVRRDDVEVLPGRTTDLGMLQALLAPADGVITGTVTLENSALRPSGVRVVISRTIAGVTESWVTTTIDSGSYALTGMQAGSYEVRADRERFTPDWAEVELGSAARDLADVPVMHLYPASAVVSFSAAYTQVQDVDLDLLAFGGVNEMRVSESPDFMEGGAEVAFRPHLARISQHLSDGEGAKTVYAQFRIVDLDGVERLRTEAYDATIVYDATPPVLAGFTLAPDAIEGTGHRFLPAGADPTSVPLELIAVDPLSHVVGVKLVVEAQDPATTPYATLATPSSTITYFTTVALSPQDGDKQVQVQLVDGAGNETTLASAVVRIDTLAPAQLADPGIVAEPAVGSQLTSLQPTLRFAVGEDPATGRDGALRMRYGVGSTPGTGGAVSFAGSAALTLGAAQGDPVQFWGAFTDEAGNELVLTSPIYTVNLLGSVQGSVQLEGESSGAYADVEVSIYDMGADPAVDPFVDRDYTRPDGAFRIDDVPGGTYQLRFAKGGYTARIQSPVAIAAATVTTVTTFQLLLLRGNMLGTFRYGDLDPGDDHGGIQCEAFFGGVRRDLAFTDSEGRVVFPGLPAGLGYTIRATKDDYLPKTVAADVIADTDSYIAGDVPQLLNKLSGDFKVCAGSDPATPPSDCVPIAYTNEADVLIGFGVDPATFDHVRFVADASGSPGETSFSLPAALPSGDPCPPGPPQPDCWNGYDDLLPYLLDVSSFEGPVVIVAQFASGDTKQPAGFGATVRDTLPPINGAVDVLRGELALLDGVTGSPEVEVDATADAGGIPGDVAPVVDVLLSRDTTWGNADDVTVSYGGLRLFDLDPASDGLKTVYARFRDAAGNLTSSDVSAGIILDRAPPTRSRGLDVVPTGPGVVLEDGPGREWWSRSTGYGLQVSLGDSLYDVGVYRVPEVAAFQVSLSQQFVGAEWATVDVGNVAAGEVVDATGVALAPVDGVQAVYARFQDAAGNVSTDLLGNRMLLDLDTLPPGGSVLLAGGTGTTNVEAPATIDAELETDPVDGAVEIQVAVDAPLPDPDAARDPFAPTVQVALPSPDGAKTVLVRFFDAAGNFSERSADIVLDTVPPAATATASCASCSSGNGVLYLGGSSGALTLSLFASDGSGSVESVSVAIDGAGAVDSPYSPTLGVNISPDNAGHDLAVSFADAAGNSRSVPTLHVVHDDTAPTLALPVIDGGAPFADEADIGVEVTASDAGSATRLRGVYLSNLSTFAGAVLQPYTQSPTTFSHRLDTTAGDGSKTVYVRAVDWAGNSTDSQRSISLDRTAPAITAAVVGTAANGPSASLTRDENVTLTLTAADTGTPLASDLQMKVSSLADFSNVASWSPYNAAPSHQLASPTVDGLKTVYVRVLDRAGNVNTASASIVLDKTRPTLGDSTFTQAYTDQAAATLQIVAGGADEVRITGPITNSFAGQWQPAVSTLGVTLNTVAAGAKVVTVEARDFAGNVPQSPASDTATITYDATNPSNGTVTLTGIDRSGPSTTWTRTSTVTVALSAFSDNVAITEMQVANDAGFAGASWQTYSAGFDWILAPGDGTRTVYVRVRDGAARVSGASSRSIGVDTTPPSVGLLIRGTIKDGQTSGSLSGTPAVTLVIPGFDAGSGSLQMYVDGDITDAFRQNFSTAHSAAQAATLSAASPATGQTKTVTVQLRDLAGNLSQIATAQTTLDQAYNHQGPLGQAFRIQPTANGVSEATHTNSVSATVWVMPDYTGDGVETQIVEDPNADANATCEHSTFATATWQPIATFSTFLLTSGDGTKPVCYRSRDQAGNLTDPTSATLRARDTIILDTTPPTSPRIAQDPVVTTAASFDVTLSVVATDLNLGTYQVVGGQYADWTSVAWSTPTTTPQSFNIGGSGTANGTYNLGVRHKDLAGNTSAEDFVTVRRDTTAPGLVQHDKNPLPIAFSGNDVDAGDHYVVLEWEPPNDADVGGYLVFYGLEASLDPKLYTGDFSNEGPSPINVGNPCHDEQYINDCRFRITGVPNGTPMFVTIAAYDQTEVPGPNVGPIVPAVGITPYRVVPRLLATMSPSDLGLTAGNNPQARSVAIRDGIAYVVTKRDSNTGKLTTVDLRNPAVPVKLTQSTADLTGAYDVYVHGSYAYIADGSAGLRVINVADPSSVGGFTNSGDGLTGTEFAVAVAGGGDCVFVAAANTSGDGGIYSYSINGGGCAPAGTPADPCPQPLPYRGGTGRSYLDVAAQGNDVFAVFDQDTVQHLTATGCIIGGASTLPLNQQGGGGDKLIGIDVSGGLAYAVGQLDVHVLYVGIVASMKLLGSFTLSDVGRKGVAYGPYYFGQRAGGVDVFEMNLEAFVPPVTVPPTPPVTMAPDMAGVVPLQLQEPRVPPFGLGTAVPGQLAVDGNLMLSASGSGGLEIYKLTSIRGIEQTTTYDPVVPTFLGESLVLGNYLVASVGAPTTNTNALVEALYANTTTPTVFASVGFGSGLTGDSTYQLAAGGDIVVGANMASGYVGIRRLAPSGWVGLPSYGPGGGDTFKAADVAVRWPYAYVTGTLGTDPFVATQLRVIDIRSAGAAPTTIAIAPGGVNAQTMSQQGRSGHIALLGKYAYVTCGTSGGSGHLAVLDLTNPASPGTPTYRTYANATELTDIVAYGTRLYVGHATGVRVLDTSTTPAAPSDIGGFVSNSGVTRDVAVSGAYLYFGNTRDFFIIEMSNPANPRLLARYGLGVSVTGVSAMTNFAIVQNQTRPTHFMWLQ